MMHFNKIKLFTFIMTPLLGLSTPVFADGGVALSTQKGRWNVGIDALYLRANTPALAYAIATSNESFNFLQGFNQNNVLIDPTYDWGFRIQAGYWFPCSCYDMNLSYTHLNTVDKDSVVAPTEGADPAIIVPPFNGQNIYGANNFAAANSKAEFNLNVVDLDAGRHVSCDTYDVRLFAGLRYANIDRDIFTIAQPKDDDLGLIQNPNHQLKSYFKGIGPRIGAQGRYGQRCGWGVDADVSMALLVGQLDSHSQTNISIIDGEFPRSDEHWNIREAKNCAIPALEAKLGIDYTYRMGCRRDASLVFEVGYQATSYLDVINTPNNLDAGIVDNASPMTSETNNVTFSGPYLGVKYYA